MMLGVMGMALAGFAGDATVLLNSYAVKEGGKIKVSCNAEAPQSEAYCAYDGNQDTYFDPGDTANAKGVSWTGIEFDHDVLVTRIVFAGYRKKKTFGGYKYPYAYRMEGGAFQGANKSDFSDAVNLHVIEAYEGEKVTVTLEEAKGPFRYLRYIGTYGGNVAEIEFYGLSDSGSVAPSAAPVVTSAWSTQGIAGFTFTADASIPQAYVFQRAMANFSDDDDYESFLSLIPALGETTTWNDTKATRYAKYRVRGVNALGASGWTYFTVEPEKLIVGAEKPKFGGDKPGFYENEATVKITYAVKDAKIYYTTDGSTPTMQSKEYTGEITLHDVCGGESRLSKIKTNPPDALSYFWMKTEWAWEAPDGTQPKVNIIRARAFLPDGSASTNEIAGTWMIGAIPNAHKLRVVSLQTDEANYFGDAKGIMVPGDKYDKVSFITSKSAVGSPYANYFQKGDDWERPTQVEMFETDGKEMISTMMGTRIRGNYTRGAPKKALACYARKEYGQKNIKKTVLFNDDPDHKKFKRFVLRGGGNDWDSLCLRDAVGQSMFRGEGITLHTQTQGYEPLVLYINGEYWGLYNLRHLYSHHHFEEWCGAAEDDIDFVKVGGIRSGDRQFERQEGDFCALWDIMKYMIRVTGDGVMDDAEYAEIERQVDIDDMIDYHIVYIFLGVNDWLTTCNNFGVWRSRSGDDRRWHFAVYDCDDNELETDTLSNAINSADDGDLNDQIAPGFFKRCYMNEGFRRRFANRYADLLNTALRVERTTNILERAIARIDHEIARTTKRWTNMGSYDDWKSRLGDVRTFYRDRPGYAWTHLKNHCSSGAFAQITVASDGEGTVKINSITSGEHFELPFSGQYFTDIPITLTATPTKGYTFAGWMVGGEVVSTEPTYTVTPFDGLALTAVFKKDWPVKPFLIYMR